MASEDELDTCFEYLETSACVSKGCLKDMILKRTLSSGTYGVVNEACIKDDCSYVVKIIGEDASNSIELSMTRVASQLKIGPSYLVHYVCPMRIKGGSTEPYTFIFQEKLDLTLGDYLEMFDDEKLDDEDMKTCKEALLKLMAKCCAFGFYHGDLSYENKEINTGNVMLLLDTDRKSVLEARLIDFSTSAIDTYDTAKGEWKDFLSGLNRSEDAFKNVKFKTADLQRCMTS